MIASCATPYIDPEVSLPEQKIGNAPDGGKAKLVVFNGSNFLIHSTNKIKVLLNGKVAGQLNLKEFLILDVPKGKNTIGLQHKDFLVIKSAHNIDVKNSEEYLKIVGTMTSNRANIVPKPANFTNRYDQAYAGKGE